MIVTICGYSQTGSLISSDSRAVNPSPVDRDRDVYADFKENTTDGLADGNIYHGVMTFRPYGATTDMSGGGVHQLGFTENQNIYYRYGIHSTWQGWKRLVFNSELGSAAYFNSDNIIYGATSAGINIGANANNIIKAGFYSAFNGANTPQGDFGFVSIPTYAGIHSGEEYNLQIGANIGQSSDLLFRTTGASGAGTWTNVGRLRTLPLMTTCL